MRCYLDIETTGIGWKHEEVTVVGLALEQGQEQEMKVIQLVGEAISAARLIESLRGVERIYTYNGSRFDLPFLRGRLGVNLETVFAHRDLMYDCWKHKLKGGLKKVEQTLGIARATQGIDGWMAVRLWWNYVNNQDRQSLRMLLEYNREDVINLRTLREKLCVP